MTDSLALLNCNGIMRISILHSIYLFLAVKNGLLASLGLCDALSDLAKEKQTKHVLEKLSTIVEPQYQDELRNLTSTLNSIVRSATELDSTLHEVLDTVLREAMARDVIHGVYQPQNEPVDIITLLKSNIQAERFSITTPNASLPIFFADPHLLKCIHRNAISNACKYGATGAPIETVLSYDSVERIFTMHVINQPGDHHGELRDLEGSGVAKVFEKGKRLHALLGSEASGVALRSSGDGAWIMQNCAKTLQGVCSINFQEHQTVFSMKCTLDVHEPSIREPKENAPAFCFPKNTWAIGLDDSRIQRKLMNRIFEIGGFKPSKIFVKGETADEMTNFDAWAAECKCNDSSICNSNLLMIICLCSPSKFFCILVIANHPDDYFLFMVDENLDVVMEDVQMTHSTISGSLLVHSLRQKLQPEQEAQTLTLIRSANDSKDDVAIYNSRAHGFFAKAPVKKDLVREKLAQLWLKRFPKRGGDSLQGGSGPSSEPQERSDPKSRRPQSAMTTPASQLQLAAPQRQSSQKSLSSGGSSIFSITDLMDDPVADVVEHIDAVDALLEQANANGQDLEALWPEIWEKLHAFKGDLVCLNDSHLVVRIALKVSNMRGPSLPISFLEKYKALREMVRELEAEHDSDISDSDSS